MSKLINWEPPKDGMLFSTSSLSFADVAVTASDHHRMALLVRMSDDQLPLLDGFMPLGGERRVAILSSANGARLWPKFPDKLDQSTATPLLKLQLITPAVFKNGWKPGWLTDNLSGECPALPGVRLTLKGVAAGRYAAVSGWDYARREAKAARFLASAGAVYYFQADRALEGEDLKSLWMASISDDEQDDGQARRDGFGLAIPGRWHPAREGEAL